MVDSSDDRSAIRRISARIDRALSRCLGMVRQHLVVFHLIVALAIYLTTELALLRVFHLEPRPQHGIGVEVLIVVISFLIPSFITFLLLWREIRKILSLIGDGPPLAADPTLRLLRGELQELEKNLVTLKYFGLEVTTKMVPDWVQTRCWGTMNGPYIGTARHLPSDYMNILREYLDSHESYLQRRDDLYKEKRRDSVRIMFREKEELRQDREKHKERYDEFVKWHTVNDVKLKLLSWDLAQELSKKAGLPRSATTQATDMACWDNELILLWRYGPDPTRGAVWLQMGFVGEPLYERCRYFLRQVMEIAGPFPETFEDTDEKPQLQAATPKAEEQITYGRSSPNDNMSASCKESH